MVVWIPTEPPPATSLDGATIAVVAKTSASHCNAQDAVSAVNDNVLPATSDDHSIPRMTWWDHRGSQEWIAMEFAQPHTFSKAEIYWFDDTGRGSCRVPASWQLFYRDGDRWQAVKTDDEYGAASDQFNVVTFEPVRTTALRVEVQLQPNYSGGVLEWRMPK